MTPISVRALAERWSPYDHDVWGTGDLMTRDMVRQAIADGRLLPPTFIQQSHIDPHARRIAWLVVHGWTDPIEVDVGVPILGFEPEWGIMDGNHRLAAAIYRGDATILAECSGDCELIEVLTLRPEAP